MIFNRFGFAYRGHRLFKSPFVLRNAIQCSKAPHRPDVYVKLEWWLRGYIKNIHKGEISYREQPTDFGRRLGIGIIYTEHEQCG